MERWRSLWVHEMTTGVLKNHTGQYCHEAESLSNLWFCFPESGKC